jgi:hypothetical protein
MAEKESHQPTHKAFTVIKREGKEDYWLDIGVAFPHKDGRGFTVKLQAIPLDAKIVCREIAEGEEPTDTVTPLRSQQPDRQGGTGRGRR